MWPHFDGRSHKLFAENVWAHENMSVTTGHYLVRYKMCTYTYIHNTIAIAFENEDESSTIGSMGTLLRMYEYKGDMSLFVCVNTGGL